MNLRAPVNPRHLLTWLGLLCGIAGLALQFWLSVSAMLSSGRDLPGALGSFFSYYTILTNTVLVLIYLSAISPAGWLGPFRLPLVQGLMLANIALVSLFVFFVLRHQYAFEGALLLADNMLHYLCPVLYLLWWLSAQPHGKLAWRDVPAMLAPTLAYFLYILARGAWVQEYPYLIIDVKAAGYGQVLINAVGMTMGLALLCAVVVGLDRLLGRPRAQLHG